MLTVAECIQVLNDSGKTYTREEAEKIRILLYQLAEKDYELFKQKMNEQTSGNIHAGINDRTSGQGA
jgi:hypothetical protein